jgi:hypothetical protein
MAVVGVTLDDLAFFDDLVIHACQEFFLLLDEFLHSASVKATTSTFLFTHSLQLFANTLLKHLQTVFTVLIVQLWKIRYCTNSREDSVVFDGGRLGTERGNHGDAFSGTESTESLMFDVSALENNSTALGWVSEQAG